MAIGQGSIIDHINKPAIHPDDAVYQSLTPTSNGKVALTVNGTSTTDYIHGKGLIKAAGHADNYLALKDGVRSGQEVQVQETGDTANTPLFVRNQDGEMLSVVSPGETTHLKWYFTSTSAGAWHLLTDGHNPVNRYTFKDLPIAMQVDGTAAQGADDTDNIYLFPDGLSMYVNPEVGQTILVPAVNAAGLDFGFDQADNDGIEWAMANETTGGVIGKSKFTAQGPAFFASLKLSMANASGTDLFGFGVRKIEAFVADAVFTGYDTYGAIGWNEQAVSPNIDLLGEVNGGNASATDSTVDFTDDETRTFMVKVSDAGVISWFIDGTEYDGVATTAHKTFDDGDAVTPFFSILQAATAQSGAVVLQELKVGYQ
tara:strand:- start:3 stop:1115 length:1113 start_codon:yes stop_codon:yes gene_type:complete